MTQLTVMLFIEIDKTLTCIKQKPKWFIFLVFGYDLLEITFFALAEEIFC